MSRREEVADLREPSITYLPGTDDERGEFPENAVAAFRNTAISLPHLAAITRITRAIQAVSRNPARVQDIIPL